MSGAMLPDFTEALQDNTRNTRSRRHTHGNHGGNRRETILSLVEMLLQSDEVTKREAFRQSQPSLH